MPSAAVDVLVPTRGRPASLELALASIDRTAAAEPDLDVRVHVLDAAPEGLGPAAARNAAARLGDAPYLALLDDDDAWVAPRLGPAIELLDTRPEIALTAGDAALSSGGRFLPLPPTPGESRDHGALALDCSVCTSTVTLRRTDWEAAGGMDESLDLFAIDYRPSIDGRTASDLVPADLDIIDRHRDETAGGSYTTRPVAVVFGGYPGEGVVQGGEVFASSENSQFNYLAFLLGEGDRIDMELVTWTVPVDPDEWLAESCAGDAGCNGAVREARYGGFRRHGLVGPSGDRAARRLWSQYFERMFVR